MTEHNHEVQELATMLIARYGERAVSYASYQALRARYSGEQRKMEAWGWISDAVTELWRAGPSVDDQAAYSMASSDAEHASPPRRALLREMAYPYNS
jgi:hypothetical protein